MAVEAAAAPTCGRDRGRRRRGARPTERLPIRQLVQISIYWLGINAIWGGVGIFNQERVDQLAPPGEAATYLALMGWLALPVVLLVQPTVGMISDYTISRWGRRKPYIVIGSILDVVFLIGLATSQTFVALVVFVILLQFSSNFAQGPFQGYVPDLVPPEQVGLASALVGRDADRRLRDRCDPHLGRVSARRFHPAADLPRGRRARDRRRHVPVRPRGQAVAKPRRAGRGCRSGGRRGDWTSSRSGASSFLLVSRLHVPRRA